MTDDETTTALLAAWQAWLAEHPKSETLHLAQSPVTEAGQRLLVMVAPFVDGATNRGMADREYLHAILAIEAEAALAATPPAIDPERLRCPKCGGEDIGTQWHQDTWAGRGRTCSWAEQYAEGQAGEHLHRYCRVCSFQWRDAIEGRKP